MKNVEHQNNLLSILSDQDRFYTYGGFGEDRTKLWEGFEPEALKMYHLGVDFNNLPVNQQVASLSDGQVVYILNDKTKFNGWRTRVIIKDYQTYYLYGHLNKTPLTINQIINKYDIIGEIGDTNENGGWFPHLHLQIMQQKYIDKFNSLLDIDGYDFIKDITHFDSMGILDPMKFVLI